MGAGQRAAQRARRRFRNVDSHRFCEVLPAPRRPKAAQTPLKKRRKTVRCAHAGSTNPGEPRKRQKPKERLRCVRSADLIAYTTPLHSHRASDHANNKLTHAPALNRLEFG